jgi:MFS family permease
LASLALLSVGALVIGFSLNTVVHRRYLLYFIPKRKLNKYLLYFKLVLLSGNAAGPLLSFLCLIIFGNHYEANRTFNEYSLPTWLTFFASLILLIFIGTLFSEPLKEGFEVYAKGQSPTDTVKRVDSFTLDDSLTIYESEKLNEINQRVSLFNDENQFDDTNLVAKTINGLVEKQLEPHGTVRTAFLVIFW